MFKPFVKLDSGINAILTVPAKTLSPNDPNFSEWWEEHKAEWEELQENEA